MMTPTAGTIVKETNGFHKRVTVRSYAVVLTEIGGNKVKAVRLDQQTGLDAAKKTAEADNPGWRLKAILPLTDRDFDERG